MNCYCYCYCYYYYYCYCYCYCYYLNIINIQYLLCVIKSFNETTLICETILICDLFHVNNAYSIQILQNK